MYNLMIIFHCHPGKREQFIERVKNEGVLSAIRGEDGCIRYDYYFSEKDPDELLLIEAWESKAHQQTHLEQPHMDTMRSFKDAYVSTTHLRVFEVQQ